VKATDAHHWLAQDLCVQRELLTRSELDSQTLVEQTLTAIAASQPVLNSYLHIDGEGALAAAKAADQRRQQGTARPLEGLPIAVKDNLDVAGMVTTAGMGTRRHAPPARTDSPAVAALRAAGAVIIGKLNMHEAALGADNDNPFYGACHNPHRPGHTPGGSSGGSAVAVAAGLCSAALGTDTMGSVRIPASYCGVAGLKPGWGVISPRGSVPVCRRLDHVGVLARSVRDVRVLLPLLAGFDPSCAQSRACRFTSPHPRPLRIGVPDFSAYVEIAPDVQAAFEAALQVLAGLGHHIEPLPAPSLAPAHARRAGLLLCEADMLVEHADAWTNARDGFSAQLVSLLEWAQQRNITDLVAASRVLDQARIRVQQWLAGCDVLALPTTPQRAFAFGERVPGHQADLCIWANMAGGPALSVPLPFAANEMPVGMQLLGREGGELQLIELGEAFQQALDWRPLLPAACASWWPHSSDTGASS